MGGQDPRTVARRVIEEVGVTMIRARSVTQTELLTRLLLEAGFDVTSPLDPARRGGTVTVRTPGFEGVHRELAERRIVCDFRPETGLRLGPHFYNTDDELRYAVEQITDIVSTGAYERHLGAAARF